jgi:3-phosphoshikimate 1-carboxyvinyltransferase
VKSAVLLAGLYADGTTTFTEPARSRDHTELMLTELGAKISWREDESGLRVGIEGGDNLSACDYQVPGDLSSAAFLLAAAVLAPESNLTIREVGLNPTRTALVDVLQALGAGVSIERSSVRHGEPAGDLVVISRTLGLPENSFVLSGGMIANLIDEIPVLAVLATQVEGRIEVRDARELRIKESDRIRTVVDGIRAVGGEIEEYEDGFAITGPQRLKGGTVDSEGDHRIAMAFAVAGLAAQGPITVLNAECAQVSFPEFYETLAAICDDGAVRIEPEGS